MDAKQEYQNTVKNALASTGTTEISTTQRTYLDSQWQSLGLSLGESVAIEDNVIERFHTYELEIIRVIMKHPSDRKGRAIIPESEKIKLKKIRENLKLNNEDIELLEAQIFEEQKEMLHALYPEESIADIVTGTVALGGIGGFFLGGIGSIFFPPLGALVFPSFGAIMVGYILGSNGQEKQRIYRQSILHKADEHRKAWGTVLVELKLIPNE